MADNYLERRMADYREGRTANSAQARKSTLAAAAKSQPVVFILGAEHPIASDSVRYYRALGWRVAFTMTSLDGGRQLAQSTGAQHHPIDATNASALAGSLKIIAERWNRLDQIINCTGKEIVLPAGTDTMVLLLEQS